MDPKDPKVEELKVDELLELWKNIGPVVARFQPALQALVQSRRVRRMLAGALLAVVFDVFMERDDDGFPDIADFMPRAAPLPTVADFLRNLGIGEKYCMSPSCNGACGRPIHPMRRPQ